MNKHPQKLNYIIKESGKNFSAGERQRLTIARALYRDSEIIVFDEATSSLDNFTEKKILNKLKKYKREKIIFMITHRLSTLNLCDKIYCIENGGIAKLTDKKKVIAQYKRVNYKNNKIK